MEPSKTVSCVQVLIYAGGFYDMMHCNYIDQSKQTCQCFFFLRRDFLELVAEFPHPAWALEFWEGGCHPGEELPSGAIEALLNRRFMKSSSSASLQ